MLYAKSNPTPGTTPPLKPRRRDRRGWLRWWLLPICLTLAMALVASGPLGHTAWAQGSLWAMGNNGDGQLGTGHTVDETSPTLIMESVVARGCRGGRPHPDSENRWLPVGRGAERLRPAWRQ